MRACGLVHSTFVTVPVSLIGLSRSNSAENEWWAWLAATGQKATIATTRAINSRLIDALPPCKNRNRPLHDDDTLSAPLRTIEPDHREPERMTTLSRLCGTIALLVPVIAAAQWGP